MCNNNNNNNNNNKTGQGYNITGENPFTMSHLLYMDDLKIYASTKLQLNSLLHTTETFSQDIHMKFGTAYVLIAVTLFLPDNSVFNIF